LFKDFDLMANTEAMAVQHSTHALAGRDSLQKSQFKLSPTGRTVDPELKGKCNYTKHSDPCGETWSTGVLSIQ